MCVLRCWGVKMIIGLTGTAGSGKGSVAEILKEKGYAYYSCSDYLRVELKKKGIEPTIPKLIELGNSIREEFGTGEIPRRLLKEIKEDKAIVDSIRHPGEIKALKESGKFVLIAVDAPIEERYKRVQGRKRGIEDDLSFEEFKEKEEKQMNNDDHKQSIKKCIEMADYVLINNGTIDDLNKKVEEILTKLQ